MTAPRPRAEVAGFGSWEAASACLAAAARRSGFVSDQVARSGASLAGLTGDRAAWVHLAPVTKADLLMDQREQPPFGRRRCLPVRSIELLVESSGTSGGDKEVHYLTRGDMARVRRSWAAAMRRVGISSGDIVAFTLPIGMSGGGIKHARAYEEVGAKLLRISHLSAGEKIAAMAHYRAGVLVATPAYLDRLAFATAESGRNLHDLGVRKVFTATQSVTVEWLRGIQEGAGVKLFEWYGTSSGLAAFTCERGMLDSGGGRGTLHWTLDSALLEIVDPGTGRWVTAGERGEVVGTPLFSEAEGLFRFRTGDQATYVPPGACPCGSHDPGIESGTVRRLDDMFKVKGVNLWASECESVIVGFDEVVDYRARISMDGERRERILLDVRARRAAPGLAERIEASLRKRTGVGFDVTVAGPDAGWEHVTKGEAGKVKRWSDERDLSRSGSLDG